jgi:D-aminopeptidase
MPGMRGRMSDNTLAVEFDEKQIDAIFAALDQCHLPGAAVGIAIRGKPVYRKSFGVANMELPVALSPAIRMRIGSTTKHFASLAYLLLCEEGKAGIDDPAGTYLPELHPVTHGVTMRQLMGHLSGLRDAHDIVFQFSGTGRPVSSADLLALYRDIDDVNAAPGTTWIYNNGTYLMLSAAIERITGQPLEDVLRERVFEPVGMYDTMLRRFDTDFVPNSATLHMTNLAGGFEKSYLGTALAGEAGMVSTVDDMLRWLAHMDAPVVGAPTTWDAMKAPQILANGASTGYGLGLITNLYRGIKTQWHGGGVWGGNSQMLRVPAAGLDIVIMVNRHDVLGIVLGNKVLDACLPGLNPIRDASDGPRATGTFRSPTTGRVIQLFAKEGEQITSIDGFDYPVVADEDGVLCPIPQLSMFKQAVTLLGDRAKPASIRFSDFGNLDELIAVRPTQKTSLRAIEGHYRSETTGTAATISEVDDGPRLSMVGRFGSVVYPLQCLADGIWRAKPVSQVLGGILSFDGDGGAFRFTTQRTRALAFRRAA